MTTRKKAAALREMALFERGFKNSKRKGSIKITASNTNAFLSFSIN